MNLRDRAYEHLRKYESKVDELEAPIEMTQEGIAAAIGVSRGHAACITRAMCARGTATKIFRYIRGQPHTRLRAVYITNYSPDSFTHVKREYITRALYLIEQATKLLERTR